MSGPAFTACIVDGPWLALGRIAPPGEMMSRQGAGRHTRLGASRSIPMFKRFAAGLVMLAVCGAVLIAEEVRGRFIKYEDGKITVSVRKKGEKQGEEKTFKVADNVKVYKGKFNKEEKKIEADGDAIENPFKKEGLFEEKKSQVFMTVRSEERRV